MMYLSFLGATGTVTGSKYMVEWAGRKLLLDCGLYQGLKPLRLRNWAPFPAAPASLDAVILTHAHLDHSGYLPRLVRDGFAGTIYATAATRDLCRLLLMDSAFLMEEEASHAKRYGWSRHADPKPLYTAEDVEKTLRLFRAVPWHQPYALKDGLEFTFRRAGHILGAAFVHLRHQGITLAFSGDLGRADDAMLPPPETLPRPDYLVVESTYGDRLHEAADPLEQLEEAVTRTVKRDGVLLIPAFAVGRTQSLLRQLWELKRAGRLPKVPIFVDSPMATGATHVYAQHASDHALGADRCEEAFGIARYVKLAEESKEISRREGPMVLISASGMATGGRILHHLKAFAPRPSTTILLAGYQAAATRGAALANGAREIRIHGEYVPVNAEVISLKNFSAHADAPGIVDWLRGSGLPPKRIFITHGEPLASEALRQRIRKDLRWEAEIPDFRDTVALE
jgi:metallo-beta-lactamase family protein